MEWYIPITILPGVGMFVLSTTSQMMTLSSEIGSLLSGNCTHFDHKISALKIKQLKRLTISTTLLYVSASCFVLSGILGAFEYIPLNDAIPSYVIIFGVILLLTSIAILIIYAFHTIKIRDMQHKFNNPLK